MNSLTKSTRIDHIISTISYGFAVFMVTRIYNNLEAIVMGEVLAIVILMSFYDEEFRVGRKTSIVISVLMIALVAFQTGSFHITLILIATVVPKILSGNFTMKSFGLNYCLPFFLAVFSSGYVVSLVSGSGSFSLLSHDQQIGVVFLTLYYSILAVIELFRVIFNEKEKV